MRVFHKKVLKNLKKTRLLGEVVGHWQQFVDVASYYLLTPWCRGFPRVCSDDFCSANCSNGSRNETTLSYTWHVLLFTHPVAENIRQRCAVSANCVLLTCVIRGWETKLVWCASLCLSWVEGYKLGREGGSLMAYRHMTSMVPQFGCVHNYSTFLERISDHGMFFVLTLKCTSLELSYSLEVCKVVAVRDTWSCLHLP
jgi:hypothetical protein